MPAPGRRQARLMNKFDTQYLIVGLLIAGAILFLDPFDFPIVDAQESNTVIGKNYNDVLLSVDADGKETHKVSKTPQRISTDGEFWHDYYFQNLGDILRFESSILSFEFYPETSDFKIWYGGLIEQRSPDIPSFSTTLKTAINGTDNWITYPLIQSSYYFSDILYGKVIEFTQNHNDVILKTVFTTTTYKGLKWTYEITNLSKENSKFGITTVCNNCGELEIDGIGYLNGEWTKPDLINEDGTYKSIKIKGFSFDPQDYIHNYLWAFKNINGNIVFDFTYSKGVLEIGDTLIIDPTVSDGGTAIGLNGGGGTIWTHYLNGVLDDEVTVTDVAIDFNTNPGGNIKIGFYDDNSGVPNNLIAEDEWSTSGTGVQTFTFTTPFTKPSGAFFVAIVTDTAGGLFAGDLVGSERDSSTGYASAMADPFSTTSTSGNGFWVEITYTDTTPPYSITDLSLDSVTTTTAIVSFTAPNYNGEIFINHMLNNTTPQTNTVIVFNQNGTSTSFVISGLTSGTAYSAQASSYTTGGGNWTFANVLNYTTSTAMVPDAPTLTGSLINLTSAKFTSTAGASAGDYPVKDYSVRCSINTAAWNTQLILKPII